MSKVLPLVSVGLPTFNRPEGLEKALNYLQKQTYKNIEIIVSDNCSTNIRVRDVIVNYSNIDSRIRPFFQKTNIEIEPNFNFVYHQSKGKYFMWLADDDEFDPDYISRCVQFLELNSDYVLCSGTSIYWRNDKLLFNEKPIKLESNFPIIRMLTYFIKVYKNGVFYGVYRNNLNFKNPIQKHIGGDWNHIARTALYGKVNIIEDLNVTRSDDGGSSSRSKIVARWKATGLRKIFIETYTAYEVSRFLFNEVDLKKRYNIISRSTLQVIVFLLLNTKFLLAAIKRRLLK